MSRLRISAARWMWMSALAIIVFVGTYLGLVRTYLGQYLENSSLLGSAQATTEDVDAALENLHVISISSLIVMMVVFALVGLIRKSWRVAFSGMATLGVSVLAAEALKLYLLPRPNLADIYKNNAHNSFPSGHTTIAMAILVALLLVMSYRWRGVTMFFALTWALSIGAATVTARWHRLSDTLGADMIALTVGALVALWMLKSNSLAVAPEKTYVGRVILVWIVGISAAISLAAGTLIVVFTLRNYEILGQLAAAAKEGVAPQLTAHLDPNFNDNMFLAAQSLAYAFSAFAALWFWATLHRIETAALKNPDHGHQQYLH